MHSVYNERESAGEKVLFGGRACVLGQSVVFTDSVPGQGKTFSQHLVPLGLQIRTLDLIQSGSSGTSRHLISDKFSFYPFAFNCTISDD